MTHLTPRKCSISRGAFFEREDEMGTTVNPSTFFLRVTDSVDVDVHAKRQLTDSASSH
jgi:hypothetical protein